MAQEFTALDNYVPTPAEEKILATLLNPANLGKSVAAKCRVAGVSRQTYYVAMRKQEFVQHLNNCALAMLNDKVGDVLNATYTYALGEKGHQDRKLLLELIGLYTPAAKMEVAGANGGPVQVQALTKMDKAEKEKLIRNVAKRLQAED